MITPEQEKWIAHLSDEEQISILPLDPTAEEKFQRVKLKIQEALGSDIPVEHHGSTSLCISGQDEIDIYIPTPEDSFDAMMERMKGLLGEPRSHYPLERARFVVEEGGKHVDVFLINADREGYRNMLRFEAYLRSHPTALDAYRALKEDCNGMSMQQYYRRKTEFFNEILSI